MGPSVDCEEMLEKLIDNGMNIARFNFSHGSYEEQKMRMDRLKKVRELKKKPIAILLDTKGPEIRTGLLENEQKVVLEDGATFTLTTEDIIGNAYVGKNNEDTGELEYDENKIFMIMKNFLKVIKLCVKKRIYSK